MIANSRPPKISDCQCPSRLTNACSCSISPQTMGAKLCLFFLPPYAPDRNPDELVWKHLKADTVGRMAVTSKEDFARKVRRSMRDLQNDARKIISFFQKPSLKYA